MSYSASLLAVTHILMLTGMAFGQEPTVAEENSSARTNSIASLLQSVDVSDIVQIVGELRKAGETMNSFAESFKEASVVAAEAADSTSQNLAAIGGEFDPFGFKTAFRTIQQQNAIIQAQSKIIMELQQKEIRRLKQQNQPTKRQERHSRRRKQSKPEESRLRK